MLAEAAVSFLRADVASLHDLTTCRVWKLARNLYVELQEPLEGYVGGKTLDALVGDPVLGSTFWTLDLQRKIRVSV